jgi:YHS domain-containing protein
MTDCAYCGCEVEAHDPVVADHDGETYPFCNWACLVEYVDREELATGTSCNWEPA